MIGLEEGLLPFVDKLRRSGPLSQEDADAFQRLPFSVLPLKHGDVIAQQGETHGHCTLILSGIATRDRMSRTGARQISGLYMPGDLVDLHAALVGCAHDSIQLFGTPVIARISGEALVRLAAARPSLGRLLWIDTLMDASISREWMLSIGRRNARTRLLHLLCELAIRQEMAGIGGRDEVRLPLTQEQLGDALGLTAVHVNRVIQSLRDDALIERDGRTIRIANWQQLVRQADFEDGYLRTRAVAD